MQLRTVTGSAMVEIVDTSLLTAAWAIASTEKLATAHFTIPSTCAVFEKSDAVDPNEVSVALKEALDNCAEAPFAFRELPLRARLTLEVASRVFERFGFVEKKRAPNSP